MYQSNTLQHDTASERALQWMNTITPDTMKRAAWSHEDSNA
jgi:hypothetical protein